MANCKYAYVKSFEVDDRILFPNIIAVWIDGRNFERFSGFHQFEKPNDEKGLKLMESCAASTLRKFSDVVFSYGFSDEYSFVLRKKTKLYHRRASKILSVITSFFTSVYVAKWNEFFPWTLRYPPSFHGRVIVCPTLDVLQQYLSWRQFECHISNQYNTCFGKLVGSGKTEREAQEILKATQKQEKNELLYQQFGINYNNFPQVFRWGSCVFIDKVPANEKHGTDGSSTGRSQKGIVTEYSKHIARRSFWNEKRSLVRDVGSFVADIGKINRDYVDSFLFENRLLRCTWIVIRLDGCHFHKFSEVHEFEKPNDERALMLMNTCAVGLLEEFKDIIFAYGTSDEYSFVLNKESQLYERRSSTIVTTIVSFFTSLYVMKWKSFFPLRELMCKPYFDGRSVCYPSLKSIRNYLAWRQVDTHINNQYNTCFWSLVLFGKTKQEAQHILKGTQSQEKMHILETQFGIIYNDMKPIFRLGSSIFRDDVDNDCKVVLQHCNIIEDEFWNSHHTILSDV